MELRDRLSELRKLYAVAVAALGSVNTSGEHAANQRFEDARRMYTEARIILQDHETEHGRTTRSCRR